MAVSVQPGKPMPCARRFHRPATGGSEAVRFTAIGHARISVPGLSPHDVRGLSQMSCGQRLSTPPYVCVASFAGDRVRYTLRLETNEQARACVQ